MSNVMQCDVCQQPYLREQGHVCPNAQSSSYKVEIDIYKEIQHERHRQDQKWGGKEHDCQHTPVEWVGFIEDYAELADAEFVGPNCGSESGKVYRRRMMQIAALAVAACEAYDMQCDGPDTSDGTREEGFVK